MFIYIRTELLRQGGYLRELYRDARSTEHKIGADVSVVGWLFPNPSPVLLPFSRITFSTLCSHSYTEFVGSRVCRNVANFINLHSVASCQKTIFNALISYCSGYSRQTLPSCACPSLWKFGVITCLVSASQCEGAAGGVSAVLRSIWRWNVIQRSPTLAIKCDLLFGWRVRDISVEMSEWIDLFLWRLMLRQRYVVASQLLITSTPYFWVRQSRNEALWGAENQLQIYLITFKWINQLDAAN